ncbi:hypothetical protein J2S10_003011 [Neobacillus ginsengisoli]|uniref:Uncharacterized protein n=1 Tax=Neobacillus ginsengisoli TaxID=904295 RepID=A0ABT9XY26_9BACI|nr:hypothetical protein [Neobacillus ginsengisoli]
MITNKLLEEKSQYVTNNKWFLLRFFQHIFFKYFYDNSVEIQRYNFDTTQEELDDV